MGKAQRHIAVAVQNQHKKQGAQRRVAKPQSWYLDLGMLGGYVGEASGAKRTYHHTAPVAMVVSLAAALDRIGEEGLENVWARHQGAGDALQHGLQEMGLELFAAEPRVGVLEAARRIGAAATVGSELP